MRKLHTLALLVGLIVLTAPVTGDQCGFLLLGAGKCGAAAGGAITFVASVGAASATSGTFTTGSIDTTGADFIAVCVTQQAAGAAAPTDDKGNTLTALTSYTSANVEARWYYAVPTTVGSGHTWTLTGIHYGTLNAFAFSGVKPTATFDVENGAAAYAPGSVTPGLDNSLILSCFGGDSTATIAVDSGLTLPATNNKPFNSGVSYSGAAGYLIQGAAAAINPTWSNGSSTERVSNISVFKPA